MALIPLRKKIRSRHRRCCCEFFFLHGLRPIFVNFVTFSTKHGSTSDKACVRLLGSRYAHANAHRRPRSRCRVFAAQTSSLSDYILDLSTISEHVSLLRSAKYRIWSRIFSSWLVSILLLHKILSACQN